VGSNGVVLAVRKVALTLVGPLLTGIACAGAGALRPTAHPAPARCTVAVCPDTLEVRFLGVGGFLMKHSSSVVLTGPMFSNPSLPDVALNRRIVTDSVLIRQVLDTLPELRQTQAILVGHGHYDHLMDVAYVARTYAPAAAIIGNRSVQRMLQTFPLPNSIVAFDTSEVSSAERVGAYREVAGGRVRIYPLLSEHTPNFVAGPVRLTIAPGEAPDDLREQPDQAWDWYAGSTLAYLIEFRRTDGTVAFRVHFQDAASTPPLGLPPRMPYQLRIDALLLTAGNYRNAGRDYPTTLIKLLDPRYVVVGHWEDFFNPLTRLANAIPFQGFGALARRIATSISPGSAWATPLPGAVVRIPGGR
jgi:hypothetical protein